MSKWVQKTKLDHGDYDFDDYGIIDYDECEDYYFDDVVEDEEIEQDGDDIEEGEEHELPCTGEESSDLASDTICYSLSTSHLVLFYCHNNRLRNINESAAFRTGNFTTDHSGAMQEAYLDYSSYYSHLLCLQDQFIWRADIDTHGPGVCRPGIFLPPLLSYEEFHRPFKTRKRRRSHGPGVVGTAVVPLADGSSTPTTVVMASEPEVVEGAMFVE